jgi:hypothetical protein
MTLQEVVKHLEILYTKLCSSQLETSQLSKNQTYRAGAGKAYTNTENIKEEYDRVQHYSVVQVKEASKLRIDAEAAKKAYNQAQDGRTLEYECRLEQETIRSKYEKKRVHRKYYLRRLDPYFQLRGSDRMQIQA